MATEIERKFLVKGDAWRQHSPALYRQGYLNSDKHRTVRVRVVGDTGLLTVKGLTQGVTRQEFEYEIPVADASELLVLCEQPLIEKYRHLVEHGQHRWEIDEFLGDNAGLVVAEIELENAEEAFDRPSWLGSEISHEPKYYNSALCEHPFKNWTDNE